MRTIKPYFIFLIFLVSMLPAFSEPSPEFFYLSSIFKVPDGVSAVISMPDQSAIAIIGLINSNVLTEYRTANLKFVANTLFIDSAGGEISSAIAIADDLRKRGIRLVVAGKCFSACANYIFTGAVQKDVLPGSLIGIHSSQIQYYTDIKIFVAPQRDHQKIEALDKDGNIKKQLLEKARQENFFYSKVGLSRENFEVFDNYQQRVERFGRGNNADCKDIDVWILSNVELQDMKITGMKSIWAPKTLLEATKISTSFRLNSKNVFFGSKQQLANACKHS